MNLGPSTCLLLHQHLGTTEPNSIRTLSKLNTSITLLKESNSVSPPSKQWPQQMLHSSTCVACLQASAPAAFSPPALATSAVSHVTVKQLQEVPEQECAPTPPNATRTFAENAGTTSWSSGISRAVMKLLSWKGVRLGSATVIVLRTIRTRTAGLVLLRILSTVRRSGQGKTRASR